MAKKKATKKANQVELSKVIAGVFLATAVVAYPLGYLTKSSLGSDKPGSESSSQQEPAVEPSEDHSAVDHNKHDQYEMAYTHNVPTITDYTVTKDASAGWNLHIELDNFEFTPENASSQHVDREGHAHIYVDGEKIGRLYGNDYHLADLSAGEHAIKVTINTNDHKDYAAGGSALQAETTVVIAGIEEPTLDTEGPTEMNHDSMDSESDLHGNAADHDTVEHSH